MASQSSQITLPAELWLKIVELLHHDSEESNTLESMVPDTFRPIGRQALKAVALTSRMLSEIAQPLLFTELTFLHLYHYLDSESFMSNSDISAYSKHSAVRLEHYRLSHSSHVRVVRLAHTYNTGYKYASGVLKKLITTVLDALKYFSRLQRIAITCVKFTKQNVFALSTMSLSNTFLHLRRCSYDSNVEPLAISARRLMVEGSISLRGRAAIPRFLPTQNLQELDVEYEVFEEWTRLLRAFRYSFASVARLKLRPLKLSDLVDMQDIWRIFPSLTGLCIEAQWSVYTFEDLAGVSDVLIRSGFPPSLCTLRFQIDSRTHQNWKAWAKDSILSVIELHGAYRDLRSLRCVSLHRITSRYHTTVEIVHVDVITGELHGYKDGLAHSCIFCDLDSQHEAKWLGR